MMKFKILFLLNLFFPIIVYSGIQENLVQAKKILQPPKLDGILDDVAWKEANSFNDFKTFIPDFGKEMPQKTIAWLAYDEENLYFAFRCFDTEPGKIKATVSARDQILKDDFICVNLDSYNDQQSLYAFYVNPLGIQADSRFAANIEDPSVDLVWYSAGKLNNDGYSVEIRLPLKSIRFTKSDTVQMGLFLERYIARNRMHGSVPEMDPGKGYAFLTQFMMIDYVGVNHYKLVEILPALTYKYSDIRRDGEMVKDQRNPEVSLTLKYGISSDLILDATLNPDFSQVEADAGQIDVNLRYQLLYPEKRPFFLEGIEKFNIAATQASVIDPVQSMVHTRTIVNPLTGVKLSGKVGRKDEINLLYSADELPRINPGDKKSFAHFPLLRYKRNLKNESFVGLLYSGRENRENGSRIFGLDGQIRLNKSTTMEFNGFASQKNDSAGNKPGNSFGLLFAHDTRNLAYKFSVKNVSRDFIVETGFLTRTGIGQATFYLNPKFYPDTKLAQKIDLELFSSLSEDRFYRKNETYNFISAQVTTGGRGIFKAKYQLSNEIYGGKRFDTSGLSVLFTGAIKSWFEGSVLYRRLNGIYYSENPAGGVSNSLTSAFSFQPLAKLNAELSFIWYDFTLENEKVKAYKYPIERLKVSYQFNKYLFLRSIAEYNGYNKSLLTDWLLSFTYVPGTVGHIGYGSLYYQPDPSTTFFNGLSKPVMSQRGIFIKFSYLIRA
jgi:hypothetical protein